MLGALDAAISGLQAFQQYLDVIGDNIANENTTAFKQADVSFETAISQLLRAATAPSTTSGGTNPIQAGLGTQLGGITSLQTQGGLQTTGNPLNMAIQGDGFFVVNNGQGVQYTRDGNFDIGQTGDIVNLSTGMNLQGWTAQTSTATTAATVQGQAKFTTVPAGAPTFTVGGSQAGLTADMNDLKLQFNTDAAGNITGVQDNGGTGGVFANDPHVTAAGTTITAYGYTINVAGLAASQNGYVLDLGALTSPGNRFVDTTQPIGNISVPIGLLQASPTSNIKLGGNLNSGVATGVSVPINMTVYDSLGNAHNMAVTFTNMGGNSWSWAATGDASMTLTNATGTVNFDAQGRYSSTNTPAAISVAYSNGAAAGTMNVDMSVVTQLNQPSTVSLTSQDGLPPGSLNTVTIGQDGTVTGLYSNGLTQVVGQVALAIFTNPSGLVRNGQNLFSTSPNSGSPVIGSPQSPGHGSIVSGTLEGSNVDIGQQFTNMIVAERSFQANSKVISTSDQMLLTLVEMKGTA